MNETLILPWKDTLTIQGWCQPHDQDVISSVVYVREKIGGSRHYTHVTISGDELIVNLGMTCQDVADVKRIEDMPFDQRILLMRLIGYKLDTGIYDFHLHMQKWLNRPWTPTRRANPYEDERRDLLQEPVEPWWHMTHWWRHMDADTVDDLSLDDDRS